MQEEGDDDGSGRFDWNVVCTPPKPNKKLKRYESKIISCSSDGTRFDYGFNPDQPNLDPTEVIKSDGEPSPVPKEPKAPTPDTELPKQAPKEPSQETEKVKAETERLKAETELEKAKAKANLTKMFMEGKITKAEFKEFLNSI